MSDEQQQCPRPGGGDSGQQLDAAAKSEQQLQVAAAAAGADDGTAAKSGSGSLLGKLGAVTSSVFRGATDGWLDLPPQQVGCRGIALPCT